MAIELTQLQLDLVVAALNDDPRFKNGVIFRANEGRFSYSATRGAKFLPPGIEADSSEVASKVLGVSDIWLEAVKFLKPDVKISVAQMHALVKRLNDHKPFKGVAEFFDGGEGLRLGQHSFPGILSCGGSKTPDGTIQGFRAQYKKVASGVLGLGVDVERVYALTVVTP